MPSTVDALNLPFDEAIKYFRGKINLPTQGWTDLWKGMHARAFVVAGAARADLLGDLRSAVDKAISDGTTLRDFKKSFADIVSRHGWKHKGAPGWRAATIFDTNVGVAYSAGHYKQMTDPDVLRARPYFRYIESSSAHPRVPHMQWYNLVLPADDPFWETHYPPNGWGCKCGVVSHSKREVDELKKEEADGPYPINTTAPKITTRKWTNPRTGEVLNIPDGIDPGWDYNPGQAAWGKRLSDDAMKQWAVKKGQAWEILSPGDWKSRGLPEQYAPAKPKAATGEKHTTKASARAALEKILGGEEKVFTLEAEGFRHDLLVNAETLVDHIDLNRTPYMPFIPEVLEDPQEAWILFMRHKGTGRVDLRMRLFKLIQMDKDRQMFMVFQARGGFLEAWTMMPVSNRKYINSQRVGRLLYAKKK